VLAVPTVSVIVVTCDRPRFLADALASVAAQERLPLEVRIGDDGGGSAAAVVESIPLLEVTLLPLGLGQPGAARNAAATGARGDVLAFLDDDDVWRPDHLSGLSQAFTDPEFVHSLVSKMRGSSGQIPRYFQVLLKVHYKGGVPTETVYILHRELRSKS